jgi:hypothetical protein
MLDFRILVEVPDPTDLCRGSWLYVLKIEKIGVLVEKKAQ